MYWGHSGVTVGSAQGMYSHCAQLRFSLKHSGQDPPLSYNLLGHWGLGTCVISDPWNHVTPPLCALSLPKLVYFPGW